MQQPLADLWHRTGDEKIIFILDGQLDSYRELGRVNKALSLREEVVAMQKREKWENHPDTLVFMSKLSVAYLDVGRTGEALDLAQKTLEM